MYVTDANGNPYKTKKAFKADVENAYLCSVSPFESSKMGRLRDEVKPGTYYIEGPSPFVMHTWYAQVIVKPDGKIIIK